MKKIFPQINIKKQHGYVAVFCVFLSLFGLFAPVEAALKSQTEPSQTQSTAKTTTTFSGFNPGTQIKTKTILPETHIDTTETIDSNGTATLQATTDLTKALAYGFDFQQGQRPVSLLLKHDRKQKTLDFSASGFSPFSKVVLQTSKGPLTLYSDWAGLIRANNIAAGNETTQHSFQIALYGGHAIDAHRENAPAQFIKIDYAPPEAGEFKTVQGRLNKDLIIKNYIQPLQRFAEQLSAVAMHYMFSVGTFLDAKEQLETQRDFQRLRAEAHKDYHPSEQMCMIGTFTKSLATTEAIAFNNQEAINSALLSVYANLKNATTTEGPIVDMENRLQQYREIYCDPQDFNATLYGLCQHDKDGIRENSILRAASPQGLGAEKPVRINKDVDFTRTVDHPLTMNIDFTNDVLTAEEEDILALARNLYWPVPHKKINDLKKETKKQTDYMHLRNVMAMNSIAHNSFATIVAMKAQAPKPEIQYPGWAYMKTMMREFGLKDEEIAQLIGKNPSYFAQMEILTKKIYQNPDFYTNLYDKPVNVSRISASMHAIELMQGRDHFDAALRREMLFSTLVEEQLVHQSNRARAQQLELKPNK